MTRRVAALGVATLTVLGLGCERSENTSDALAIAISQADPHAAAFAEYETWVVRALSVAPADTNRRALTETLFAPIRNDSDVMGVMVQPSGKSQATLSFPGREPWAEWSAGVAVRHPVLGWVRVATVSSCPTQRLARRKTQPHDSCVLIARDFDHARSGTPRVMMAFAIAPEESATESRTEQSARTK